MSGPTNSDYSRAITELTIGQIWDAAGLPLPIPYKDGVVRSPFRDERTASFSILGGGRGFKDFGADQRGGVVDFARLCWPNLSDEEFKDRLVEIAGTRTHRQASPAAASAAASGTVPAPAPVDPLVARAAKALEKKRKEREAEENIYALRKKELEPEVDEKRRWLPEWPSVVRDRYQDGADALLNDGRAKEKLAKARGWPYYWIDELIAQEKLSYVLERGCDAGANARRQKGFLVEFPTFTGSLETGITAKLHPIGYHQRFFSLGTGGRPDTKGWMFIPGYPKGEPRSQFERALVEVGRERGIPYDPAQGSREAIIAPLPFVLGDVGTAKLIVLLEGQWDAISFWGACGWFHDATEIPAGIAVFGIRGAQGMPAFLAYWGRWLRANKPLAWVIADNDSAGRAWREDPAETQNKITPPSLAEKLEHAGCRRVVVSWLRPGLWGKDFNDYYKAAKPDTLKMYKWMMKVGVMDGAGGWAK